MFILANFINAITTILDYLIDLYLIAIIVRAVISWIYFDPYNPIVYFIKKISDPFLNWIRKLIPTASLGIDLSPFIAFLIIVFIKKFLIETMFNIAVKLK
ncbi:YggT family protein [Candidatus Desantisbacteria bacterium]|nr:YggT family protein [Candidatus Desantisbacteria bacterium]